MRAGDPQQRNNAVTHLPELCTLLVEFGQLTRASARAPCTRISDRAKPTAVILARIATSLVRQRSLARLRSFSALALRALLPLLIYVFLIFLLAPLRPLTPSTPSALLRRGLVLGLCFGACGAAVWLGCLVYLRAAARSGCSGCSGFGGALLTMQAARVEVSNSVTHLDFSEAHLC